jgi:hypothetical protein
MDGVSSHFSHRVKHLLDEVKAAEVRVSCCPQEVQVLYETLRHVHEHTHDPAIKADIEWVFAECGRSLRW